MNYYSCGRCDVQVYPYPNQIYQYRSGNNGLLLLAAGLLLIPLIGYGGWFFY